MVTDSSLIAKAETAQELASALIKFQAHVLEAATEIAALVSELYAISAASLELNTTLSEPRNYRNKNLVDEDRYVLFRSLDYTFKDLQDYIGNTKSKSHRSQTEAHLRVWIEIDEHFHKENNRSLLARLEYYRRFIDDLTRIVQGRQPSPDVDVLYERINFLLSIQNDRLVQDLENLTLGALRVPSWERVRDRPSASPGAGAGKGGVGGGKPGYQSPRSPSSDGYPPHVPEAPRRAPSSPSGATSTFTTDTRSTPPSSADSSMQTYNHWLPNVFAQSRPTTRFSMDPGPESCTYGEHMSGILGKLREGGYDELLRVPFDAGQLEVRLYCRDRDRKARILCRSERGGRRVSCCPISELRVVRRDTNLQFCKLGTRRRLFLWANLRFPSYERLVLFYCSYLALKAQDESEHGIELEDHILNGERAVFSAVIIDDKYDHALQIFKDGGEAGIRLQASVLRGRMKRSPVWTAFINYKIPAREWAQSVGRRKVQIADLQRYIFTDDYIPEQGPNGEHEIVFTDTRERDEFMRIVEDLAEHRL